MIRTLFLTALLLLAPLLSRAQQTAPLEVPTGAPSMAPRLVALGPNRALLSWLERKEKTQRFRAAVFDGTRFGAAFTIARGDNFFVNWADTPGVGVDDSGAWFAHWLERSGRGTYAYDVRVAISRDQGASWSEPLTPHNDGTLTEHGFVSHFIPASGDLGLVWLDGRLTRPDVLDQVPGASPSDKNRHAGHHQHVGGPMTLRSATVSREGVLREQAQLDGRVCDCCATDAGMTDFGPVVVYRDRSEDEVRDIKLVRQLDRVWSEPVTVHEDGWRIAGCPVNGPALLARGKLVVVAWFTLDRGVPVVRVARSTDGGGSFSAPLDLDRGDALGRVDLAWTDAGHALVWLSRGAQGGLMRLAHFSGADTWQDGVQLTDVLPIDAGRSSGFPRLLQLQGNRLLLAWTETAAGDDGTAVEAAILTLAPLPTSSREQ